MNPSAAEQPLQPSQQNISSPQVQKLLAGLLHAPKNSRPASMKHAAPRSKLHKLTSKKPPYVTILDRPPHTYATRRSVERSRP